MGADEVKQQLGRRADSACGAIAEKVVGEVTDRVVSPALLAQPAGEGHAHPAAGFSGAVATTGESAVGCGSLGAKVESDMRCTSRVPAIVMVMTVE